MKMRTMTMAAAARWAGVSPRMLSLFLTGRVVDSLSEIDVDAEGLAPELVDSMPGQNTGMMGRSSRTAGARRGGLGVPAVQRPQWVDEEAKR